MCFHRGPPFSTNFTEITEASENFRFANFLLVLAAAARSNVLDDFADALLTLQMEEREIGSERKNTKEKKGKWVYYGTLTNIMAEGRNLWSFSSTPPLLIHFTSDTILIFRCRPTNSRNVLKVPKWH